MYKDLIFLTIGILLIIFLPWGWRVPLAQDDPSGFTTEFPLRDCVFVTQGTNNFFNISPGRQMMLNNLECFQAGECEAFREIMITALNETRNVVFQIDGQPVSVDTRVVLEQETVNGRLAATARRFYAECQGTGDVYKFGETVQILAEDGSVSTEGSWLTGVDGALPGLAFPGGAILLGSRYFQELVPDVALDRAEHVATGLDVTVPAGTFAGCVEVRETTGLDPTAITNKIYCPTIGLVIDDEVELIEATGGSLVEDSGDTVL